MIRVDIIAMLALALVSFGLGYFVCDRNAAQAVATAHSDTTTCIEAVSAKDAALASTVARLEKIKADHAALLAAAHLALDARDAEIAEIKRGESQRTHEIKRASKHDLDCITLADMPVCSAVARQLWPAAAAQADRQPAPTH